MNTVTNSKYRDIAETLKREIASGRWSKGKRLPGETVLARRFSVAHMTVRRAVDSLIDDRVLVRIPAKGTFVVDPKAVATDRPIVLLFPSNALEIDPYYFPELLDGFRQVLESHERSFTVLTYETAAIPDRLEAGSLVACLLIEPEHVDLAEQLRSDGALVVAINRHPALRSIASVYIDDARGVERAVDHLVEHGHRSIGFLKGPEDNLDARERLRGFRDAVQRHELPPGPEAVAGFREAGGYDAAADLLSTHPSITAIVCASDLSAIGAICAARDIGLSVPEDLSVVGFGDFAVADYVSPRLTTIRQRRGALGCAAAIALLQLESDGHCASELIESEFVIRQSVVSVNRTLVDIH